MRLPKLSPELIEQIKGAPLSETNEAVGKRLGVATPTVKKYRQEARHERQEAGRALIAQDVQENLPDALSDLHDLRRLARTRYERHGQDVREGQLWLSAIKATLEHVSPDDAELDRSIAAELARLEREAEARVSGTPEGD